MSMPTTWSVPDGLRRRAPEGLLALLAMLVFLGCLGSVELWGKREQRASAEAIDTLDHGHWLVARIQGRPRLEKPPLPRWTIAALMTLTGRRDEWMVRLPGALSALGMVGLTFALGRRLGGRSVGLASAFVLTSMGFFVSELRQAGNDGPLAFFTTLALYAAWRRLHGHATPGDDPTEPAPEPVPGGRGWNLVMYGAAGLGFLCKGPVVVMFLAVALVPYLLCARRLKEGLGLLSDGRGVALFLLLALSWPAPVVLSDPNAAKVWLMEMGQKAGMAGITHHRQRLPLAADWLWMTVPWGVVASMALALPFLKRAEGYRLSVWFPWWWAVGNLAVLCFWSVAKPNYYLPCLPAAALLTGLQWVRLTRAARQVESGAAARRVLQFHWVALFVGGAVLPVITSQTAPALTAWAAGFAVGLCVAVVVSVGLWRKGADAGALAPLVGAFAMVVLAGYGAIAPAQNDLHGHRALAEVIDRVVPVGEKTVMFFHEVDEGLWFYLHGRELAPVPGSRSEYNDAFRLLQEIRNNHFEWDFEKRSEAQAKLLVEWLKRPDRSSSYVLIRDQKYDKFAPALSGLAEPVHREQGLKRNGLVLLRVTAPGGQDHPVAALSLPDDERSR